MSKNDDLQKVKVRRNFYDMQHPDGWDPANPRPSKRFRFEVLEVSKERADELVNLGFAGYCDDKGRFIKEPKAKALELEPLPDNPKSTTVEKILNYAGHKRIALSDEERQLTKKELLELVKRREDEITAGQGVESEAIKMSTGAPKE